MSSNFQKNSSWLGSTFLIAILMGSLAGCAGHKTKQPGQAGTEEARSTLSSLSEQLDQAAEEDMPILSPENYKKAVNAFNDAKKAQAKGKDPSTVDQKAAQSEDYLAEGRKTSQLSESSLASVLDIRNSAKEAGAEDTNRGDFRKADNELKDVTRSIEKGDTNRAAAEKTKLLQRYTKLEKEALRSSYLEKTNRYLQQAKNEGGEKWAPKTIQLTEKLSKQVDQAIDADPGNKENISRAANRAQDAAELAVRTTRESKALDKMSPEDRALELEGQKEQIQNLTKLTEKIRSQQAGHASKLQRFDFAARTFSPDEANVYRKGNELIIQLKGLQFPSGKADIPSESYPLLNKVDEVVEKFGPNAKIIVQGNSDSVGNPITNKRLSRARAEAVKDYLINAKKVPSDRIETRALSASKPIASNKTNVGRQENRRVDLIIQEVA